MSRIGRKPIPIPESNQVNFNDHILEVSGPKGKLSMEILPEINIEIKDNQIFVTPGSNIKNIKSLHGLTRTLVNNMIIGVSEGFTKQLEMKGVGYRAEMKEGNVVFNLGFSHPVIFKIPETIDIMVNKNVITISGCDKQLVGQTAARIRALKPPEPYKGKGIKYADEIIRRKAGKAVKAAEGAGKGA